MTCTCAPWCVFRHNGWLTADIKDAWNLNDYLTQTFGYCLYFILAFMVLVGLTGRFYAWIMYRPPTRDEDRINRSEMAPSRSWSTRLFTRYRKHVETPALFGYRHSTPAYGFFSIPTRIQGFFVSRHCPTSR